MVRKTFHTEAIDELRSEDQLDLLDSIDHLRSQGISSYVSLPQIIVVGDQSSGKSSVLEAISGVTFPIKSNLCTRFPTELILRKTAHTGVRVSIIPNDLTENANVGITRFKEELDSFEGLPALVEKAKEAMAIFPHGRAFSKDRLRVEVSGPDRPHLTIVDLPGLIHSQTKQQSAADVELVKDIVHDYMKAERSVILAVISAKNDYANQIVLKLARAVDEKGTRTLGIITKPDTLIPGSENEDMFVSLAKNQDVEFRHGWHVVKNMDSDLGESVNLSMDRRDEEEIDFFARGVWRGMPSSLLGIKTLRRRLNRVLLFQIVKELPSLIEEMNFKSKECLNQLVKLGKPRATVDEQRLYLLQISEAFQLLIKAAVDGTYNDPFFGDARTKSGYNKRVRAVVQNLNMDFSKNIEKKGHTRQIVSAIDDKLSFGGPIQITRTMFLDRVEYLLSRTRARELPGTCNPMIVADLFLEQSKAWEQIAKKHVESVWLAAKEFLNHITTYVTDTQTRGSLWHILIEPALDEALINLNLETTKILAPHQKGHPITYNKYFTESLQNVRQARKREEYTEVLKNFSQTRDINAVEQFNFKVHDLIEALLARTESDLDRSACAEALDCMEAYYKVALKRFLDDIAIEVIETKLVSPLQKMFCPMTVITMPASLVTDVAGESEESQTHREQLHKQLDMLKQGLETCKRFAGINRFNVDDELNYKEPISDLTSSDDIAPGDNTSISDLSSQTDSMTKAEVNEEEL